MNIGLAVTGSFCTYHEVIEQIKTWTEAGHKVLPIVSREVLTTDTRFGDAKDFLDKLQKLTKKEVVSTIVQAEILGPSNAIDVLAVAPCTGNTLAKLANGISDDAVSLAAKAHMRNFKPLVIGISTNDALGVNMLNLARLMNEKQVYFVPFRQDNPEGKPKSMMAKWGLLLDTMEAAMEGKQIQPVVLG